MSQISITAYRERKNEFAGVGALLQGLGLLAPFVMVAILGTVGGLLIGVVMLIVLFIAGRIKSRRWVCGHCKNPIASKEVTVCPACRATLQ